MTKSVTQTDLPPFFQDHTQLPESDGTFVNNFQAHYQSLLLTDSLTSTLQRLHPDGYYCIGQDCGIYWRETEPPEKGAEAPDWFSVGNVPPKLQGQYRRSYVIWREHIAPRIVLELASGDGSEERDRTPLYRSDEGEVTKPGKFWVYEQIIRAPYYGIFSIRDSSLDVYHYVDGFYQQMTPNERGHYPIPPMQVELGVWEGSYQNQTQKWLRWWDLEGDLLLIGQEEAQKERQEKELERQKRQELQEKLRSLSPEQLAALGIDLDAIS
ncbi:Uma2 family endonuclease [Oscillatoria acuminata]|uniref:Putative restriction endonuclease domain-containing protein n=1 Tax=Oscillatoria acuminata PCC 6304 TaxID=56110 RepID=K9TML0_9CYAN|nr:Uma2 family endonuclease [Oscillatoria acuminata]AFY83366.1 hypothetical protein Oscil6304_3809 [Oscillatoria acuminata PCC 6304]